MSNIQKDLTQNFDVKLTNGQTNNSRTIEWRKRMSRNNKNYTPTPYFVCGCINMERITTRMEKHIGDYRNT